MADRARLLLADLEPLAVFLCGPRWQTALARRINRSPRLVRRWVAGDRPIDLDQLAERRPAAAGMLAIFAKGPGPVAAFRLFPRVLPDGRRLARQIGQVIT